MGKNFNVFERSLTQAAFIDQKYSKYCGILLQIKITVYYFNIF